LGKVIYEDINTMYQEVIEIDKTLFGEQSEVVADKQDKWCAILLKQGRIKDAESKYRNTLAIREKSSKTNSLSYAGALNNLAVSLKQQGLFSEAQKNYEQSLEILIKLLGPNHPNVTITKANLAAVYKETGQSEKMEQFVKDTMENVENEEDTNDPSQLETKASLLQTMGDNYKLQNQFDKAEESYLKSLEIRTKISKDPENDPDIAKSLIAFGKFYSDCTQKFDKADECLVKALNIYKKYHGTKNEHYSNILSTLANLRIKQQKFEEAEKNLKEALEVKAELNEPPYLSANTIQSLAVCYERTKKWADAEKQYKKLLEIIRSINDETRKIKERQTLVSLSNTYIKQEKISEACPILEEAKVLALEEKGEKSREYGKICEDLGNCLVSIEKYDESERELAIAKVIYEEVYGLNDERTRTVDENLTQIRNVIYDRDHKRCCIIS
jgi:tetratricopeptide (TPR) repeat protein